MTATNIAASLRRLLDHAEALDDAMPADLADQLTAAQVAPLDSGAVDELLDRVVTHVRDAAARRGDRELAEHLATRQAAIVDEVAALRRRLHPEPATDAGRRPRLELASRDNLVVGPVVPAPMLNGREIRVRLGFVRTRDVDQWDANSRLEVHIEQYAQKHGHPPDGQALLDIMLNKMELPGVETDEDEFEIKELARSIASNKVRVPVIIDQQGWLLDGNRRHAACSYILADEEFDAAAKSRAEWLPAWQLDEFSDEDDARHVVVALNFPEDPKVRWPKYVRARKVVEELRRRARMEPAMDERREKALRREVADYFGIKTPEVTGYLKMIDVAEQFEGYHVEDRRRDPHEVKHKAMQHFEYFDELSKGGQRGVYFALQQNDDLRRVVFDLLLQDKFTRFSQIRHLKHVPQSADALQALREARDAPVPTPEIRDDVKERIDDVLTSAAARAKERRELDPNTKIEDFVSWLRAVPLDTLPEKVKLENLLSLQTALKWADKMVEAKLEHTQLDLDLDAPRP